VDARTERMAKTKRRLADDKSSSTRERGCTQRRPTRGKHMKWTEETMLEAIKSCTNDPKISVREAAKRYEVPRATLQSRVNGKIEVGAKPGRKPLMAKGLEEKLLDYADNRAKMGIGFGKTKFMEYAGKLAQKHGCKFKRSRPSNKWWRLLNRRHKKKIALRQPESTAAVRHQCMNPLKVGKYFHALHDVIKDCQPQHIWNMDETGLQPDAKTKKIVAEKGARYLHMRASGNREMITVIACVNAAEMFVPPHIIPKGTTIKALQSFQTQDAPTGTNWSVSDSGWTKQGIAKLWFTKTFMPNIGTDRPQVLILDGHDSHNFVELIELAIQNRIEIVELPAHTSNWLQPCDRTIFKPFKEFYASAVQEMKDTFPGVVPNKANFTGLFRKAWEMAMTKSNIQSGFKACGIYPFNPSAIPPEAYMPNYLYSVETLLKSPELLNQLDAEDAAIPPALTCAADHCYTAVNSKASDPADQNNLISNDCTIDLPQQDEPVASHVDTECSTFTEIAVDHIEIVSNLSITSDVVVPIDIPSDGPVPVDILDISYYIANCSSPNFSSPFSPSDVLVMMESAMNKQQLHCFQYCLDRGIDLCVDEEFEAWKQLKLLSLNSGAAVCSNQQSGPDGGSNFAVPELVECHVIQNISVADVCALSDQCGGTGGNASANLDEEVGTSSPAILTSTDIVKTNSAAPFPFNNASHPDDVDSDILTYPSAVLKREKKTRNTKTDKFFVLTSKEAYESKLKQAKEKADRELKKQERAERLKAKKSKDGIMQMEKVSKKKDKQPQLKTASAKNGGNKNIGSNKSKTAKSKGRGRKSKEENWKCVVCNGLYFDKNHPHFEDDWVMCIQCNVARYHSSCAVGHGQFDNDDIDAGDFTCASCYENMH